MTFTLEDKLAIIDRIHYHAPDPNKGWIFMSQNYTIEDLKNQDVNFYFRINDLTLYIEDSYVRIYYNTYMLFYLHIDNINILLDLIDVLITYKNKHGLFHKVLYIYKLLKGNYKDYFEYYYSTDDEIIIHIYEDYKVNINMKIRLYNTINKTL